MRRVQERVPVRDRYQFGEMTGEGSSAIVFHAYDTARKQNVAIKLAKSRHWEDIRQLEHEASLLKSLRHKHIVRLLDSDLQSEAPHLVMELCDRGSMRNWLGRLRIPTVLSLLDQAIQGLKSIHDRGGFHGDIKPDNLLVQSSLWNGLELKIADFGTARLPGVGLAMDRGLRGTRGYIAPEVLQGKPFNAASDIYSLGVTITEWVTYQLDVSGLCKTNLPVEVRRLVQAMTNVRPEERPDAGTILAELRRVPRIRVVVPKALRLEIS